MEEWRDPDKNDDGKNGRAVDGNAICVTEKTIGLISGYNFFERHESDDRIHAFHCFWKSGVHYLFTVFAGFHTRHIKAWVKCIEVFGFQLFLDTAEGFTEALEVYDFTCAEEFNGVSDFRNIADHTEDVVIGGTCFLFCCKVFEQIGDGVAFALKFTCIERNASGSLGPDSYGMVDIVRSKTGIFDLFHGKISGKLMDDSGDHFQVRKFFCTCFLYEIAQNMLKCIISSIVV